MAPLVTKVIVEIGRAVGKAVIAGVAVECARLASLYVRKRLGPEEDEDKAKKPKKVDAATLKSENERLKDEVERLRNELAAVRAPEG